MTPGITIDKWGPSGWNILHVMAHTWPRVPTASERENMKQFLKLFAKQLPCPSCKRHFLDYLEKNGTDAVYASRETLVTFLNDAHNDVNRRLGKRQYSLKEHYAVYKRPSPKQSNTDVYLCLLASIIGGVLFVSMTMRKRCSKV